MTRFHPPFRLCLLLFGLLVLVLVGCDSGTQKDTTVAGDLVSAVTDTSSETVVRTRLGGEQTLTRFEAAPKLDGQLDDACWTNATLTEAFASADGDASADRKTVCALGFDDEAVYFGFRCGEPQPQAMTTEVTEADQLLAAEEFVEVQVNANLDLRHLLCFAVTPKGVRTEAAAVRKAGETEIDAGWDGQWQAVCATGSEEWLAEIRVPFETLGLPGLVAGQPLAVNLVRHASVAKEHLLWQPESESVETLGVLRLGDGPYKVELVSPGDLAWGRNSGELRLSRVTDETTPLDIVAKFADGEATGQGDELTVLVPEGKSRKVRFNYEVTRTTGAGELVLTVTQRGALEPCYYARFPLELAEALRLSLSSTELPADAATATVNLGVRVGADSLGDTRIELTVSPKEAPDETVTSATIKHPKQSSQAVIDLSPVKPGEYVLSGELSTAEGEVLGRAQQSFSKQPTGDGDETPEEPTKPKQQRGVSAHV